MEQSTLILIAVFCAALAAYIFVRSRRLKNERKRK